MGHFFLLQNIHATIPQLFSIQRQIGRLNKWQWHRIPLPTYLKNNNYLSFSFVRHPFDRLVSAYREKVEMKKNGLYVRGKLKKLYGKTDFHTFLQHVINTYTRTNLKVDRHWRSFNSRCTYCSMKYDVIGRAETFNEDAK